MFRRAVFGSSLEMSIIQNFAARPVSKGKRENNEKKAFYPCVSFFHVTYRVLLIAFKAVGAMDFENGL